MEQWNWSWHTLLGVNERLELSETGMSCLPNFLVYHQAQHNADYERRWDNGPRLSDNSVDFNGVTIDS